MKCISYRVHGEGVERYGVVSGKGIVDATSRLHGAPTLRSILEQGRLDELDELVTQEIDHEVAGVEFCLPITQPRKILCAGRNYRGYHELAELSETPEYPSIFGRFANSFSAHQQPLLKPRAGEQLDYEGELVVVVGSRGRHLAEENALDHVMGYTCMNEGTVRDWMRKGTQNTPAKNFFRSGGLGPWIVTKDEVPDPSRLHMTTRRNGRVVQDGGTDRMIFSIPFLLAHISKFTELEPGDLIATGSPGGSAIESDSPEWLRDGDEVEIEISGIGTLRNPVALE